MSVVNKFSDTAYTAIMQNTIIIDSVMKFFDNYKNI
jgi:hypothetical protein